MRILNPRIRHVDWLYCSVYWFYNRPNWEIEWY